MKLLTKKEQRTIIRRLKAIRVITDDAFCRNTLRDSELKYVTDHLIEIADIVDEREGLFALLDKYYED